MHIPNQHNGFKNYNNDDYFQIPIKDCISQVTNNQDKDEKQCDQFNFAISSIDSVDARNNIPVCLGESLLMPVNPDQKTNHKYIRNEQDQNLNTTVSEDNNSIKNLENSQSPSLFDFILHLPVISESKLLGPSKTLDNCNLQDIAVSDKIQNNKFMSNSMNESVLNSNISGTGVTVDHFFTNHTINKSFIDERTNDTNRIHPDETVSSQKIIHNSKMTTSSVSDAKSFVEIDQQEIINGQKKLGNPKRKINMRNSLNEKDVPQKPHKRKHNSSFNPLQKDDDRIETFHGKFSPEDAAAYQNIDPFALSKSNVRKYNENNGHISRLAVTYKNNNIMINSYPPKLPKTFPNLSEQPNLPSQIHTYPSTQYPIQPVIQNNNFHINDNMANSNPINLQVAFDNCIQQTYQTFPQTYVQNLPLLQNGFTASYINEINKLNRLNYTNSTSYEFVERQQINNSTNNLNLSNSLSSGFVQFPVFVPPNTLQYENKNLNYVPNARNINEHTMNMTQGYPVYNNTNGLNYVNNSDVEYVPVILYNAGQNLSNGFKIYPIANIPKSNINIPTESVQYFNYPNNIDRNLQ